MAGSIVRGFGATKASCRQSTIDTERVYCCPTFGILRLDHITSRAVDEFRQIPTVRLGIDDSYQTTIPRDKNEMMDVQRRVLAQKLAEIWGHSCQGRSI